jgi:hypothetical protein
MRQNIIFMESKSIENKIIDNIKKCGRGKFTFASNFVHYGEQKSINKALERIAKENIIIRISRGVYYYLKIENALMRLIRLVGIAS